MADSLRKRYAYKLLANGVSLVAMFVVDACAARALGPRGFGNFQFLNGFFQQIVTFLDLGASTALATRAAQRPGDGAFIRAYWRFLAFVGVLLAVGTSALTGAGLAKVVWPAQEICFVWLALVLAIATQAAAVAAKLADAHGLTVASEIARVKQRIALACAVAAAYFGGLLDLGGYFLAQIAAVIATIWLLHRIVKGGGRLLFGTAGNAVERRRIIREYFDYTHPLAVHAAVSLLAGLGDLWLLQHFGGSIEQGYYGLALRISAVCLVFTTAMTPLLLRDFAVAAGNADVKAMAALYTHHIPLLFSITAVLSCFVALNADRVALLVGGEQFAGATAVLAVLAFYPIQQTFGQLGSSIFLATGKTHLHRNLGIAASFVGLPAAYFAVAPSDVLGLNGGALGLAVKMMAVGTGVVGVMLFLHARMLKTNLLPMVRRQLFGFACIAALAAGARWLSRLLPGDRSTIGDLMLVAVIYFLAVVLAASAAPTLFGLRRADVVRLREILRTRNC